LEGEIMSLDLKYLGLYNPTAVYRNLTVSKLTEHALERKEGVLSETGAMLVNTGKYTGRSPDDKFIVDEPSIHGDIAWGKVNMPISPEKFESIYRKMCAYLQNRELFVFDGFAGADPKYRIGVRVVNELASQNMFMHQMLLRPTEEELVHFSADYTIICAPGFKCIPELDGVHSEAAILVSFERKMVVIAGSQYAGEMKKSVFSVMNYVLPKQDVFSMHCSANIGKDGDSALFFGLSGTGKTTLSAAETHPHSAHDLSRTA
jgi:phosphoenolpyruvate carboxykinase (ATP)